MKVTNFSVSHPMSVYVLIVTLIVGGLLSYFSLPREAAPDIAIPVVIVNTPYFGVSPVDIEMLVTRPLEKQFKGLRSLKKMNSTSAESVSLITLEFEPDIDVDDALQRIRVEVEKAKPDLPKDAEETEIIEINSSDWPILIANVSGNLDLLRLKDLAENLQDDLESVPGVLRVGLAGGVEREIQIAIEPDKMQHHGVSANEIINAVQTENVNIPGGSLDIGSMKYIVRVAGEFQDMETIRNIVVKAAEGQPVYLRDVATVHDSFKEQVTFSRLSTWATTADGKREIITRPSVSLSIIKRGGSNIIEIAEEAKKIIARYDEMGGESLDITIVNDMSESIKWQVQDLENNIITGLILVLAILFMFMGGVRNALFVSISVPLSMLISFIVLALMGITLNMVVLFALVLALGMLVDNAIVIVENIYRHASEGKSRVQAALDGTAEVGWPVIAATATTVAAFAPLLFWPGVVGKFMGFLPLTVIITLLSSLFVALVINPTLCASFLKVREDVTFSEDHVPDNILYRTLRTSLEWSLNWRLLVIGLSFAVLIGTFAVFASTTRGVEFFPNTTPEQFNVSLKMADGTSLAATGEVLEQMQAPLLAGDSDLVTAWITDGGMSGGGQVSGGSEAPHQGQITVELVDVEDQKSDPLAFMETLRQYYKHIPGATIVLSMQSMGPPTGAPVSVEIAGDDLRELASLATEVRGRINTIPGLIDLQDDIEVSRPEIHVVVDRQKAALVGLSSNAIAQTVRTAIHGVKASNYREGDDEYDITVRLPEMSRTELTNISNLMVTNHDGFHIPLTEVASVEIFGGSGSVRRKEQKRVVSVTANAADGYLPARLLQEVQSRLEDMKVPAGYEIRYTGESEDQAEASEFLGRALLVALFLILLILVTQFDSIMQPMIVLVSVVLSLVGVLWVLILTGEAFGIIMTGIGIISLAGIVVNNAIVLIDYINLLRKRGYERREAVIQGALVRMRPVLLTAATTVLGMLPLVIGVSYDFINTKLVVGGTSPEMWGQMARVVSGGLVVSTILTLIVVPVLYSLVDEMSEIGRRRLARVGGTAVILMFMVILPAIAQAEPTMEQNAQDVQDVDSGVESEAEVDAPASALQVSDSLKRADAVAVDIDSTRVLSLEDVRKSVHDENFNVQKARTQITVASAVIRQAWGALHPQLVASGSYTINEDEVSFEAFPGMDPMVVQPRTDYRWSVSASLRANFRSYPMIRQAYAQRDLAEAQVEVVRENLDMSVVDVYYNLLSVRQMSVLAAQQLENNKTMLRATEARRRAETATEFEVTRAKLRVVQAEKNLERARLQFIQLRASAAELFQTEPDFDVTAPPGVKMPESLEALKAEASQNRASLRANTLEQLVAERGIEETYWQYMPVFSATFTYAGTKGSLLSPGDPRWMLTFGADWTLWDGGMRGAQTEQRRAQLLAVEISRRQELANISSELDRAWAQYLTAQTQVESSETELELATISLQQAQKGYQYGVSTQLDLINAQDQLELARISQIQDELALELSIQHLLLMARPGN